MRHTFHIALLAFAAVIIGCESQSPFSQNDLTFTHFKGVPDTSSDYLYPVYPNPFNRVTGDTALFTARLRLGDRAGAKCHWRRH
jgi:hypothetical protein